MTVFTGKLWLLVWSVNGVGGEEIVVSAPITQTDQDMPHRMLKTTGLRLATGSYVTKKYLGMEVQRLHYKIDNKKQPIGSEQHKSCERFSQQTNRLLSLLVEQAKLQQAR